MTASVAIRFYYKEKNAKKVRVPNILFKIVSLKKNV